MNKVMVIAIGVVQPESGKTGHTHENEANTAAAIMMRNFAQMRPEMFIVK